VTLLSVLDLDDAMKPSEFLNIRLDPTDEQPTGGGKAHVEPGIHIALVLGHMIPIDIQDGAGSLVRGGSLATALKPASARIPPGSMSTLLDVSGFADTVQIPEII